MGVTYPVSFGTLLALEWSALEVDVFRIRKV